MTIVIPNQGEQIALEALVNKTAPQDLKLCLYKTNVTLTEAITEGSLTEADFTGYAEIALAGATWAAATAGDPSYITYAQQTFTSTAGSQNQTIYGYYIKQTTSGKLIWAEAFSDGPYSIVNLGDTVKITPRIEAS